MGLRKQIERRGPAWNRLTSAVDQLRDFRQSSSRVDAEISQPCT
eukprot:gene20931-18121_t